VSEVHITNISKYVTRKILYLKYGKTYDIYQAYLYTRLTKFFMQEHFYGMLLYFDGQHP
jgi:hypothetical protein